MAVTLSIPPGAVRLDESESIEGNQSVVMTTQPGAISRTWLVSQPFRPPPSGRLAVSLACRAERKPDNVQHRIQVSIEGIRNGVPFQQSNTIEIPCNGQWRASEIALEVDRIDPTHIENLRLTIDSVSAGRVWIDDIRLHDQFALAKERGEVEGLAFLAVQGLQRGNLAPAAKLLTNYWARHLLAQPLTRPLVAAPATMSIDDDENGAGRSRTAKRMAASPITFLKSIYSPGVSTHAASHQTAFHADRIRCRRCDELRWMDLASNSLCARFLSTSNRKVV